MVLTASKELEPGFRAMLLLAEGLFRLDVAVETDTLRTVVRNLSNGQLDMRRESDSTPLAIGFGDIERHQPGQTRLEFSLGEGVDRVDVDAMIGTLRMPDRGMVRVSAHAIVRHGASS